MAKEATFERVKQMIVERFGISPDKVTPEMTFADLGADSLDVVEFVMESEDAFGVQFEDERIEGLNNVGEVVDYIDSLTA